MARWRDRAGRLSGRYGNGCGVMDDLRIGDRVRVGGRELVVRGFDPMSLPFQTAELQDLESGALLRLPLEELRRAAAAKNAGSPPDEVSAGVFSLSRRSSSPEVRSR